jgi:mxaJ protein
MCSRFLKEFFHANALSKAAKAQFRIPLCVFAGIPLRLCVKILLLLGATACANHQPAAVATVPQITRPAGVLRVCADPNNLPFSNQRGEGFENKIAELLAHDLGERVEYTWWAQRRGFFRNTLRAGMCDVVIGVPSGFEMALTTRPYYRSSYVFLSRKDRHLNLSSFDDPQLKKLRIGVQIIGDDQSNAPPAHALTRRKIVDNVKGFTLYGDYSQPNPPARIVDAVEKGDIDLAIVWGPLAGYFAKQSHVAMQVVPVTPQIDQPFLPFVFDISMGVRRHRSHP